MASFMEAVLAEEDIRNLRHWERELVMREPLQLYWGRKALLYCCVTDIPVDALVHAQHRVLALAGDWSASRLILMDKSQHVSYHTSVRSTSYLSSIRYARPLSQLQNVWLRM